MENDPNDSTPRPQRKIFGWCWRWFWRASLPISLCCVWYCFYAPKNDVAWASHYASAQEQSKASGKPILLFFTGKWCVPCRIMKRNVWADPEVESIVNARFTALTVDLGDSDAVGVSKRYDVVMTPTTVIVDSKGLVRGRIDGGVGKTGMLELLGTFAEIDHQTSGAPDANLDFAR